MSAAAALEASAGARPRAEPAPSSERWREAAIVALGPTLAALVSLSVGLPGFIGPTVAYFALQRIAVSSWHALPRRLAYIAATGLLLVPLGGFLLQQPWFLLPAFFAAVTLTLYFLPLQRRPVEGSSILFVIAIFTYEGLFAPAAMATSARNVAIEAAIGVIAATLIAETFRLVGPRSRLAESLGAAFAHNRERFRTAIDRYRATSGARSPLPSDVEATSTLSGHLQLLDQVRQEGVAHDEERTLVALITAAERIESYASTIDYLSREDVARTYRRLLDGEIEPLAAAIDGSLAAYERAARRSGSRTHDVESPSPDVAWPDLVALVRALEARQLELRRGGRLAVDVRESANTNACVRMLAGLADVLHTPPEELARIAAGAPGAEPEAPPPRRWPSVPRVRPFDLRYALQGGLGTTLCLIVGVAANLPQLSTILFNPILVAQTSYGATVRRAGLRMLGVILGAVLGIAAIAVMSPNTMDVTVYIVLCFVVAAACQYAALGAAGNWYASFQVAISFFVVTYSLAPSTDVEVALWRAWGTVLGTALLFAVYAIVAPDYAGRQLVERFGDLLRSTLEFLPRRDAPSPPLAEQIERRLEVGRAVADGLRLADEARFERRQGIDPAAALDAVGLAMRLAYRSGLVARGRAIAPPPALAEPLAGLIAALEADLRAWVAVLLAMVEARHTMARPGALAHRRARERAASALAGSRPDVAGRERAVIDLLERTHFAPLSDLPPRVSGELLSALAHYRRLGDLLPRLERSLVCALLPGHALAASEDDASPEPPARAGDSAA